MAVAAGRGHQFVRLPCAYPPQFASDRGLTMDTQILFRTNDIVVTPAVVRFGPASYQVAAISSVGVGHRKKLNPIALIVSLSALGFGAFAYLAREHYPDYGLWSAAAAPVALIFGVGWQWFRPVLEYRFVMRIAGAEAETRATFDRAQAFDLRQAFETAFLMQHQASHQESRQESFQEARQEPHQERPQTVALPASSDERQENNVYITRDWTVANATLAPR